MYCTAEHDSLKISNGKWYWWSRGFGGYSALDYLIKVKEYDFVEAVIADNLTPVSYTHLVYFSTRRNYRRREEHGSAKWGNAGALNKKYRDKDPSANKLLTQNVRIGLDGKKHRRNLNILVCGGSGAGKTRFFCKPNAMQCNTSFVILDPKGEIVRDIGGLLENKGYEVRVLDLINMHRSHCYNPFVYLRNDNDVQRLSLIHIFGFFYFWR